MNFFDHSYYILQAITPAVVVVIVVVVIVSKGVRQYRCAVDFVISGGAIAAAWASRTGARTIQSCALRQGTS